MIIAEKEFVINSSQQRIWDLLLKAVLKFMPFERMRPLNERTVSALLKVKMSFISMPMNVEVEVTQTSPPKSMITMLRSKAMAGLVWINQKATFNLESVSDDKTRVSCKIEDDGMGIIVRLFLLWRVKSISRESFVGLEERLKQWA